MVGKVVVIFKYDVTQFLSDLTQILYKEHYFSFIENAYDYVDFIYDEIETNIHFKRHFVSPKQLIRHGKYYIILRVNKRTVWYVFFDKSDSRYIIRYISNNHVADAGFL